MGCCGCLRKTAQWQRVAQQKFGVNEPGADNSDLISLQQTWKSWFPLQRPRSCGTIACQAARSTLGERLGKRWLDLTKQAASPTFTGVQPQVTVGLEMRLTFGCSEAREPLHDNSPPRRRRHIASAIHHPPPLLWAAAMSRSPPTNAFLRSIFTRQ